MLPDCTWYQGQWAAGAAFRKPEDAATLSLLLDAGHGAHILAGELVGVCRAPLDPSLPASSVQPPHGPPL